MIVKPTWFHGVLDTLADRLRRGTEERLKGIAQRIPHERRQILEYYIGIFYANRRDTPLYVVRHMEGLFCHA